MWGGRARKSTPFVKNMFDLCDYQAKASRHRKGLTYLKNRATTNKKQIIHSQKNKKKRTQHKEIIQQKKKKKEKKKEKDRNKGEME